MGTRCSPSQKASTVTSGPTMHSSMTTVEPLWPNLWSSIISRTAVLASSTVEATTTPLPRARPSALMTMGAPFSSTKDLAASSSVNTPQAAVGTPAFCMMSLAKALLPSSCAHHWLGPKQRMPA